MSSITGTVLTICITVILTEVVARFSPKNNMISFVRALIFVLLFLSAIAGLFHMDVDFDWNANAGNSAGTELNEYLGDQYEQTVQRETSQYITGLLETIQLSAEEIEIKTDKQEDGSIIIQKITVTIWYEADRERTVAVLSGMMGNDIETEVKCLGG